MTRKKTEPSGQAGTARKPGNSRSAILNAAIVLFGRRGIDSVTIRDLELGSGVAAPTIYHFFGDKRKLYDEAISAAFVKIEKQLFANLQNVEDPRAEFRLVCNNYMRVFSRNTMFTRIFMQELHRDDHALKRSLTLDRFVPAMRYWQSILNRLVPGAGDGQLPLIIISSLTGMGMIASIRKLAPPMPSQPGSTEEKEAIIETLLAMVLRSAPASPPAG